MAEIPAVRIDAVYGSVTTDDGQHMMLDTEINQQRLNLAISISDVLKIIDLGAVALTQSAKARAADPSIKAAFEITWWEVGEADGNKVIFSMTFGAGGTLSFWMHRDAAKRLQEVLSVSMGLSTVQKPDTRPN